MPIKKFTFIDLFSGIGGFHLALQSFGGECVFASEIDSHAREVYTANFKLSPHLDITKIAEKDIPNHDVLCAGFPCQAFSVSGKRQGFKDARGTLFFDILRIVKKKKPKIVFLENVKNFLKHDQGNTFKTVKYELERLGYEIHHRVLCSSDFKVPQSRERIYIIAFKKSALKKNFHFNFPRPSKSYLTVEDILLTLTKSEQEKLVIKRNDITIYRTHKEMITNTRPFQIGTINKGGQGERIYSIKAQGITLSAYGGGAAAKTGAFLINKKIRRLHPRECFRMQGFPDNFKIHPGHTIAYKQIGNSVSVPVIKKIFKEIIKTGILN